MLHSNCREEDFVIKKDRNIVPYTEVIGELNGKEIVEICHKKYLQKTNQTEFITEKLITKKGNKLYVN